MFTNQSYISKLVNEFPSNWMDKWVAGSFRNENDGFFPRKNNFFPSNRKFISKNINGILATKKTEHWSGMIQTVAGWAPKTQGFRSGFFPKNRTRGPVPQTQGDFKNAIEGIY